jgi:hypothetical protein
MRLEKGEDSRHSKGKPNKMEVRRTNKTTKESRNRQRQNKWVMARKEENKMVRTVDGA